MSPAVRRKDKTFLQKLGRWTRPIHAPLVPVFGGLLVRVFEHMPHALVRPCATGCALATWPLVWIKVRGRILTNYGIAFGDTLRGAARRRRFRRTYVRAAIAMFEAVTFGRDAARLRAKIEGLDEYARRLEEGRSGGRGLLVLTGHLGAWEILGLITSMLAPAAFVAKRTKPDIDRILERVRSRQGGRIVFHDASPRELLRTLQRGEVVGIVADRIFKRTIPVTVPFFGKDSAMPRVPFTLARKVEASVLFAALVPVPGGRYRVVTARPRHVALENAEDDARAAASEWARFLETVIRAYPESWLPLPGYWKSWPTLVPRRAEDEQDPTRADASDRSEREQTSSRS